MKLDTSKFNKSLLEILKKNDKAVNSALYQVGIVIVNRAEPLVPIKEGNLVGSFSISVGKRIYVEEKVQNGKNAQAPNAPDIKGTNKNELRVGYNMPYAWRLHEFPFKPGEKSREKGVTKPGYKWLTRTIATIDIPKLFTRFYKL
jgi:hypothetical protein